MKCIIRSTLSDGKIWFPIVDIVNCAREGSGLNRSANAWFKNNIDSSGIGRFKISSSGKQRAGQLLCVDSFNVRIVGMYEAHLQNGMDFRAKWADLPDTPLFCTDIKRELSWRNLYKWSKKEHTLNSGLGNSDVSKLRVVASNVGNIIGKDNPEMYISYNEALSLVEV